MTNITAYVIGVTSFLKAKPGSVRREYLRAQRTRVIGRRLRQADIAQIDVPSPGILAKHSAFHLEEKGRLRTQKKCSVQVYF